MTRPAVSPLDSHLGYWLRFVSNHVSHAFARKVETRGVTVAEWVVLRELYDRDGLAPSILAERIGMTRGAITKLADRLIDKHLVTRRAVEADRRFQILALTAGGRRLVPALAKLPDVNDAEFFAHLSSAEQAALTAAMKAIVKHHGLKAVPVD
jgi:DNA-binding MarR family transcriptional regulator